QQPQQSQATVGAVSTQQPQGYVARCPYCGKGPIPAGAKFCPFCGHQIKWCPNGHVVPMEANFCPVCGSKVGG
ncbi:MAG: hypothetical protein DRO40_09315, partial [Thermoprotei archaeon]